jgi:myo-inositol-1(or 4)-monophosphatase
MYKYLIALITKLGDQISEEAGSVKDVGIEKEWLTEKDIMVETSLASFIKESDPEAEVYAEELHSKIVEAKNVWIIDPISNTFNFIHGLPCYTVVVSHMYMGDVVFAAVYDPTTKELFSAEKGKGMFVNGKQCHTRITKDVVVLLSGAQNEQSFEKIKQIYNLGVVRIFGSVALHYAYVACGRATAAYTRNKDTFPEFAGKLLVEEGGGIFTDIHEKPLTFESQGIVAGADKTIHKTLIDIFKP